MNDFRKTVLKVNDSRKHKVTGSLGVYDAYKYIRKNKWFNIGRPLTEHEFYSIIRRVNEYLAYNLLHGHDIILPNRMGRLELRKTNTYIKLDNGKLKTNLPIDWDRTLQLWQEDEEAYNNKTLLKIEQKELFKCQYNKDLANYKNKSFYQFSLNRDLKKRISKKIKNKELDALSYKNG